MPSSHIPAKMRENDFIHEIQGHKDTHEKLCTIKIKRCVMIAHETKGLNDFDVDNHTNLLQ